MSLITNLREMAHGIKVSFEEERKISREIHEKGLQGYVEDKYVKDQQVTIARPAHG